MALAYFYQIRLFMSTGKTFLDLWYSIPLQKIENFALFVQVLEAEVVGKALICCWALQQFCLPV